MALEENNSSNNNNKLNEFECHLDSSFVHFLIEPRILPCSKTACLECIQKRINKQDLILKCSLCNQEHRIESVADLSVNQSLADRISSQKHEITNYLIARLNKHIESLNSDYKTKEEAVEQLCAKAKSEIEVRVELLKIHIESLHKEILESLAKIKAKVINELKLLNERITVKSNESTNHMEKVKHLLADYDLNREKLEEEIYTCQNHIHELKQLDENFGKILRKVSFEPSEWLPDENFIFSNVNNNQFNLVIDSSSDFKVSSSSSSSSS